MEPKHAEDDERPDEGEDVVKKRYVDLEVLSVTPTPNGSTVHFRMPPNSQHAPRGYYMLFLVTAPQSATSNGTPSRALWVKLE